MTPRSRPVRTYGTMALSSQHSGTHSGTGSAHSDTERYQQRNTNEEQLMAGSSHGHTPAAWTGVIISFIGFCIAGVFMVAANPLGFWAGIAVTVIGGIVGLAMKAAGLGMPKESAELAQARARAGQAQTS